MLIFIENTPRAYAWGSRDALPELLGVAPTGEPQAELWLGDHPSAPASLAKARPAPQTLIELIASDPDQYGVDGKPLPFLLKVLGIGAPLSLQVHPDKQQAEVGFAREEGERVPQGAPARCYGDANHKPELLVALSEVSALCGFRPLAEARGDLLVLAAAAAALGLSGTTELLYAAEFCITPAGVSTDEAEDTAEAARRDLLVWALSGDGAAATAVEAIEAVVTSQASPLSGVSDERLRALVKLSATHPRDPGVLISLLLNLVTLQPGEAVFLGARQLHAYLGGMGVEVMAASDNVLRAGLTEKHMDVAEVLHVVDPRTLEDPRFEAQVVRPGLLAYEPEVPDFRLWRARLHPRGDESEDVQEAAEAAAAGASQCADSLEIKADYPLVLIVTAGRVRVERVRAEFDEVASVAKGQSLYVSAGEPIELSGRGEAFVATVGKEHLRVSQPSSAT